MREENNTQEVETILTIGKYTIIPYRDGSFFMRTEDGEGLQFHKEQFEPILEPLIN